MVISKLNDIENHLSDIDRFVSEIFRFLEDYKKGSATKEQELDQ